MHAKCCRIFKVCLTFGALYNKWLTHCIFQNVTELGVNLCVTLLNTVSFFTKAPLDENTNSLSVNCIKVRKTCGGLK